MWSSVKLGPQLSFAVDVDAEPVNDEEKILTQAFRNFEDYNGTGGSFLRFLVIAMMKGLKGLGPQQFNHQHIREAMSIIEDSCTNCCASLKLVKVSDVQPILVGAVANSPAFTEPKTSLQEQSDASMDIDEDTDWFFLTDEAEQSVVLPANVYGSMTGHCEEESESDSDSSQGSILHNELPSTNPPVSDYLTDPIWLAAGLQHCLPFEYTLHNSTMDSRIALPMHLATQVKKHLFDDRREGPVDNNNIDPLFAMSSGEGSLKSVLQTHLHVHTVPGLSSHRCCVYPNALLLSCATRDCDQAKTNCQHVIHTPPCSNTAYGNPTNTTNATERYIFRRTVVLQANIGMIGQHFVEKNSALGNSQQARSINLINTMTGGTYLQSLQNSHTNAHNYVYTICAALHAHRVDLLLCEVGMVTTELIDTLSTFNIAVLPLATIKELNSAADLCDATVLDDVIGMCEQDIGRIPLQLQYLLQLPTISVPTGTLGVNTENTDTPESVAETGGSDGQECLVVLSRYDCTTTASTANGDNERINNSSTTASCDSNNNNPLTHNLPHAPISVLICAPTEAMVLALSDKFYKCLHRWRAVCEDGGAVMMGAGLPELLCVLRLEEVKTALSGPNNDHSSAFNNNTDYAKDIKERNYCVGAVIECFQQCLQQYILCILMNNGYSFAQGTERIHYVTNALTRLLNAHNELQSSSIDILDYILSLSTEEKLALPVPLDLSSIYDDATLQHVLDPVQLKINTVKVACSLLLQLRSIVFI